MTTQASHHTGHQPDDIAPPSTDLEPCPPVRSWQPHENRRVLFLRHEETCPICRTMWNEGARLFGAFLHVVVNNGRLIVTDAENLDFPGRVLVGSAIVETSTYATFELDSERPEGLDPTRHLAAEGIATLTFGPAPRLRISARMIGLQSPHRLIIDAME